MQRRELIRGMTLAGVGSLSLEALNTAVAETSKTGDDNTETAKATDGSGAPHLYAV